MNGHSKVLPPKFQRKGRTDRFRTVMRTSTHFRDHLRLQVAVKRGTLLSFGNSLAIRVFVEKGLHIFNICCS